MKKITSIILIFCMCISFCVTSSGTNPGQVYAKTALETAKDKKAQIEKQLKDAEQKLKKQKDIIKNNASEAARIEAEEKAKQAEREKLTAELMLLYAEGEAITAAFEDANSGYERAEEAFYENASAMYIYSQQSTLEIVANAESISDFVKKMNYMSFLLEENNRLMEELEEAKLEYEYKKMYQEESYEIIEMALKDKDLSIDNMTLNNDELRQKIKKAQDLIVEIEKKENSLEEDLKAVQSEIKKLEEAEKKAAADKKAAAEKKAAADKKAAEENKYKGGKMLWPVPGHTRISSNYGNRTDPFTKKTTFHAGIDIPAPKGSAIVAAADGKVTMAKTNGGYGKCVKIDHGSGIIAIYAHCNEMLVKVGDKVKKGDLIAKVGTTGRSTGNHLHFEVRVNGKTVDPIKYLKG